MLQKSNLKQTGTFTNTLISLFQIERKTLGAVVNKLICEILRSTSNSKHAKRYCNISKEKTFSHCVLVKISVLNEE